MVIMFSTEAYTMGLICATGLEYVALQLCLDEIHAESPKKDNIFYTLGEMRGHNVVIIAVDGGDGTDSAASLARDMHDSFPKVRMGLIVGIGGGAPSDKHDVRLGDIVVGSSLDNEQGEGIQLDSDKGLRDQELGTRKLRAAVNRLESKIQSEGYHIFNAMAEILKEKGLQSEYKRPDPSTDRLYQSDFTHPPGEGECRSLCMGATNSLVLRNPRKDDAENPIVHLGVIASSNKLMEDAMARDELANKRGVLCCDRKPIELVDDSAYLVVRGISDYADSHKNKIWQKYAAIAAAAYTREMLSQISPVKVENETGLVKNIEWISASLFSRSGGTQPDKDITMVERSSESKSRGDEPEAPKNPSRTQQLALVESAPQTEDKVASVDALKFQTNIIEHPKKFYKKGRVFMTIWAEPKGLDEFPGTGIPNTPGQAFTKICRFIVVRTRSFHCICLPIHTYRGQATTKRGVVAKHHAPVVQAGEGVKLHPEERELEKQPIRVRIENHDVSIDQASRVDFSRVYSVEYNLQVRNIGRTVPEDTARLEAYFAETMNLCESSVANQTLFWSSGDFKGVHVALLCTLPVDMDAMEMTLDEVLSDREDLAADLDDTFSDMIIMLGRIGKHQVVIARPSIPWSGPSISMRAVATFLQKFSDVRVIFSIGATSDVSQSGNSVRLGDVVIAESPVLDDPFPSREHDNKAPEQTAASKSTNRISRLFQRHLQRHRTDGWDIREILAIMAQRRPDLRPRYGLPGAEQDRHFEPNDVPVRPFDTCDGRDSPTEASRQPWKRSDPSVHLGVISLTGDGMGNVKKDVPREPHHNKPIFTFETNVMRWVLDIPCLVVCGISDYGDDRSSRSGKAFAAAVAAACVRRLLSFVDPEIIAQERPLATSGIPDLVTKAEKIEQKTKRRKRRLSQNHNDPVTHRIKYLEAASHRGLDL